MDNFILDKILSADKILIGLGENFVFSKDKLNNLADLIKDKDYYIISLSEGMELVESDFDKNRIVEPIRNNDKNSFDQYLKWLSMTLNRNLIIIEFEVSFDNPTLIRFPFEKTCYYNKKAFFIRVNSKFAQIPEEISEKAVGYSSGFDDFCNELMIKAASYKTSQSDNT